MKDVRTSQARQRLRKIPYLAPVAVGSAITGAMVILLSPGSAAGFLAAVAVAAGALLVAGLLLWWPSRKTSQGRMQVGVSLLTGAIVSLAFLYIQVQNERAAEREHARDLELQSALILAVEDDLSRVDLHDRDLSGLLLQGKTLVRADLSDSDLSGAFLGSSELRRANLNGVQARAANLSEADLRDATLNSADFTEADLSKAKLVRARADGRVVFKGANLIRADLRCARLPSADFTNANLRKARLARVGACPNSLRQAQLSGACLENADMRGRDLSGAVLRRADLHGADLRRAKVVGARFDGARANAATKWPASGRPRGVVLDPERPACRKWRTP